VLRCLTVLLFLLLLVSVAFAFYAWGRFQERTSQPLSTTPAPAGPTAGPAPPAAKPVSGKNEIVVEVTEAELSQQLNQELAGRTIGQTPLGPATVERLQVTLRGGSAQVNGSARVGGVSAPVTAVLTGAPEGGRVKLMLREARIAGLPAPEPLRAELEGAAQRELDQLMARQRFRVTNVEVDQGRLRASGVPG
jgi:hypothetical protein